MESSGMPSGSAYNPSGEVMPTDGGPGSSSTPAPGPVASPGSDEYTMNTNTGGGEHNVQATGGQISQAFAPQPTPDN